MSTGIPTVKTCRLILRAMTPEDTNPLHRIMGHREVMQYFPRTDSPSRERVARLIGGQLEHWKGRGYGWWALDHLETREFVGWCGLQYLPETDEVEVAYLLGKPSWGLGLATEAANASVRFGFVEVGLETIVGLAHPENVASQRVLRKLGMSFVDEAIYFGMAVRRYSLTRASYLESSSA